MAYLIFVVILITFHATEIEALQETKLFMGDFFEVQSIDPKLSEAESRKLTINVSQRGTGQFKSISEALHSIPQPNSRRIIISIGPGVYREKIAIPSTLPFITFLGDAMDRPTITWNDSYSTIGSDGKPLETYNTATVGVDAEYFISMNLIFQNTASYNKSKVEQAVALRITGNKAAFYNCKFYGVQDTLYDQEGLHYFRDCYIEGSVDFVFGHGRSLYEGCTLNSIARDTGFITAQERSDSSLRSGFSFINSTVKGSGHVYLGRPWGNYSRVVFSYTFMDKNVLPKGWEDHFGNAEKNVTKIYYGEYKCSGPGSNFAERAPWVRHLTDEEAQQFISIQFIQGDTWLISPPY